MNVQKFQTGWIPKLELLEARVSHKQHWNLLSVKILYIFLILKVPLGHSQTSLTKLFSLSLQNFLTLVADVPRVCLTQYRTNALLWSKIRNKYLFGAKCSKALHEFILWLLAFLYEFFLCLQFTFFAKWMLSPREILKN